MAVSTLLLLLLICSCLCYQVRSRCVSYNCPKVCPQSKCTDPPGDDCNFYTDCLQFCNPCPQNDDNYALNYGQVYCDKYDQNMDHFTEYGQNWVKAVKKCLQKKIAPDFNNPLGCVDLKRKAFKSHPGCYATPGDPDDHSFCDLSCKDFRWVLQTVYQAFIDEPWESVQQVWDTYVACEKRGTSGCLPKLKLVGGIAMFVLGRNPFFATIKIAVKLTKLAMKLSAKSITPTDLLPPEKRSLEVIDYQNLAERMVAQVFSKMDLPNNGSIEWFVLSARRTNDELEFKVLISDKTLLFSDSQTANSTENYVNLGKVVNNFTQSFTNEKKIVLNGAVFPVFEASVCENFECTNNQTVHLNEETTTSPEIYTTDCGDAGCAERTTTMKMGGERRKQKRPGCGLSPKLFKLNNCRGQSPSIYQWCQVILLAYMYLFNFQFEYNFFY